MTIYSVQGPDGRVYDIEGPEGASEQDVIAALQSHLAEEAPAPKEKPKSGFIPNVKASTERLKGDYYAGLAALGRPGAAEEAAAHRKKAEEIAYTPELTEHPWEFLKSVAGGSVPYIAAPLVAGAAANPLGAGAAMGAAGLASAGQFTGSFLSRQLEEGVKPENLSLGKAAAAAIPAAALDVVGFKFIPGIRMLFGKAGVPITEEAAKSIAGRYILPAAKTAGVEGATEVGQAVLERLQAGLNIGDPEARKEYFDNFLGGAVLGGAVSVPGTMLEGRGKPKETGAPEVIEPTEAPAPTPERERGEITTIPPTERGEIGVAPYKAPEEAAVAAPAAAPQPNVIDLMDQYTTAHPRMEALQEQIRNAAVAGDTTKAKELYAQLKTERESLAGLKTQIEDLGGVAQTATQYAKSSAEAMGTLDKKIKAAQKSLSDAGELGDFDKVPKLAEKLEKLQAERDELQATQARHNELLRIQGTPKGETIPLFAAEEAQPKTTEVIKPEENKEVTAKEAAIEEQAKKLVEMTKAGPQPVAAEDKAKVLAELNDARQKYQELQAVRVQSDQLDDAKASMRRRITDLENQLASTTQSATKEGHINLVNQESEKLNKLYAELDALRGGKEMPTESPMELFKRENLIRTAVVNGDKRTAELLRRAQKEEERRGQRGMSDKEQLAEKVQRRFDLPGTVVERAVFDEDYDATVEEIDKTINKIVGTPGNAKESYLNKAERLYREMQTFAQAAEDPEATPHQRAMARRTFESKFKEYETILNGRITPAYNELYDLYTSLYTKKEVKPASEIEAEKQKETDKAGKAQREVSKEVKRATKIEAGEGVKAAPARVARVAREIGYETDEYQKLATAAQKKVDAKVAQYNKFVAGAKAQLEKLKGKKGDPAKAQVMKQEMEAAKAISDNAPDDATLRRKYNAKKDQYEAFVTGSTVSKKYKDKEAAVLKAANEKLDALNKFKQSVADALDAKAEELGRASPKMRSELVKATKERKEAAAETTQTAASKRTVQVTRKLPKLGVMSTGTEESKARSAGRQAKFEETLEKSSVIEQRERVQKALKETKKTEGKPKTAMGAALTQAAKKKGAAFRTDATQGAVVDPNEAKGRIVEIKSRLPKGMNLIYEPTLADIKPETLAMLKAEGYKEGNAFKGVVLSDGTIVVVGDQHTNMTDLEETLYHEMVGHYGIDTVIGLDRLEQYARNTDLEKLAKELGGQSLWTKAVDAMNFAVEQKSSPDLAALREIIAYTAQQRVTESFYAKASRFIKELIGMMRDALRSMGFKNMAEMSATDVFKAIKSADTAYQNRTLGPYRAADGVMAFRSKQEPASIAPSFVATKPAEIDSLKANFLGLAGRVQFVDRHAALSEAQQKAVDSKQITPLEGEQVEYFLRFGENRSQYAGQFLTNGPVSLSKQETKRGKEFIYKSSPGANMMQMADAIAPSKIGNDTEKEAILTALLAGKRAEQVGWNKLNFENPAKMEQEYNQVKALLDSRPQDKAMFDKAMDTYKQYNAGLLDFLVQTGTMTKEKAAELKKITYVPYYRVNKGTGEIELLVDKEHPVRIGNIKDEPQLQELVGSSTQILPIFTSAVQNTFMLTDMALRNQAVKESAFMLNKVGIASAIGKGSGPANASTVRFKHNGEDHFVSIDTDLYGIPASLIVKGMEGIKTTIPAAIRMLGMPADILRKFVTRNPAYAIKQAIRDPLTAWMTTGADGVPVLNGLKELSSMVAGRSDAERKLMEAGAISSNVFTGDKGDIEKFLKEISMGRTGWEKLMARADAFALQGDAATRAVIYKDSLNKGMSEMQAMLRTLESMNFGRRGLSPSMQMLSVLIPFFNAQIQGLDVLYRAFTGKMPYSQQLEIRKKMLARGFMLAAGTLAYAAMMEDDDAYKKAKPEERLGNWFLPTPLSEEPLRIPVPFELGYLFKSLPEAVYNMAADDERNNDITKGMSKLVMLSNPFALPQAIKPATEAYLGKSFFGGDIESQRELHSMVPSERYRESTTEVAKMIGSVTGDAGLSPIKLDYLIRGYTGGLGIALVSMANPILNTEAKEAPSKKTSQLPFVGGLFQPIEGRGTLDAAYERMLEVQQAQGTYKSLIQQGKKDEANAFREEYADKISSASVSGAVQQKLGELAKMKRQIIAAPNLPTERKDELLKNIEMQQNNLAERFLRISDRTTRLAAQP